MSKVVFARVSPQTHRGLSRLASAATRRLGHKVTVQDVAAAAFAFVLANDDTGALSMSLDGDETFTIALTRPRVAIPRTHKESRK